MSMPENFKGGFLKALLKDPTANTIVIGAASLVPMIAMVGGAVDASRFYMTETRLQAACDAGALAARRAMQTDTLRAADRTIGLNFFDQNYPEDTFGLQGLQRNYTGQRDGTVNGTASGTLPTSLMGMFGYEQFNVTVNCEADINVSNTDIMFVLDTTGSMSRCPNGRQCNSNSNSRIAALRRAVLNFYDTIEGAASSNAQVRYGIMPYANQVNVGSHLNTAWLADNHDYNSRRQVDVLEQRWVEDAKTDPIRLTSEGTGVTGWEYDRNRRYDFFDLSSRSECEDFARAYREWDVSPSYDLDDFTEISSSTSGRSRTVVYEGPVSYDVIYDETRIRWNNRRKRCRLNFDVYEYQATARITVTETLEDFYLKHWNYASLNYDLTDLYSNGSIQAPTGTNGAMETHTWDGCIEEADTVRTGTFDPIPAGANDLIVDLIPNSDDTYWKPRLSSLYFLRYDKNGNASTAEQTHEVDWHYHPSTWGCPKPARKLAAFNNRSELSNYLSASNGFVAAGNTYHDFGMIWGARFISPDGIFAAENRTAPNGDAISRHIVFMTDGELVPSNSIYGLYGVEWWDRRISTNGQSGNGSQMNLRHAARFQAACKAARNKNISVWVVAFGTALTQNLTDCASPGRAFSASDEQTLQDTFREIAENIAALRLTA